jgi:hypothetical protein
VGLRGGFEFGGQPMFRVVKRMWFSIWESVSAKKMVKVMLNLVSWADGPGFLEERNWIEIVV